ncbi:MAG TPA: hypothetical protein VJ600_05130 [Holophagaceae bacterium]|nr:hypothetical protein [Holophagaceae bacterium]
MASHSFLSRLSALGFAFALTALPAADAPARPRTQAHRPGASEADDAEGRRAWNRYWFGDVTPEYLAFKNGAAAREVARWGSTFPRSGSHLLPATTLSGPTWTNLGPTANTVSATFPDIDSGRPRSVVTDPTDAKILYLATSGGGVWKCTNADLTATTDWTWTPVTDSLPASGATGNVSVGALAMSPTDHLTLYLGLGDPFDAAGTGIYVTHDGGSTWTAATLAGATPTFSTDILALSGTIVLAATDTGLFRSTDGGATFSSALAGLPSGLVWSVQKFSATELICTSEAGGMETAGSIYYSSDAGATWTLATATMTSPGRITVATSPASGTQAWGIYENLTTGDIQRGLLKTTDKGHTWTFVAAPTVTGGLFQGIGGSMSTDGGQGFYNHGIAVDPANINHVFVGANLALYRSLDGGATWAQMTHWYGDRHVYAHADYHCARWSQTGTSTLFLGNDGGLCIVRDPFRATIPTGTGTVASDPTFIDNRRNRGLVTHLVYNLGSTQATNAADAKYRIALGMQDNGTRVRIDTGSGLQNSSVFDDHIGGDGFGTVWSPSDATLALGSYYYSNILFSTDGGTNFSSATGITEANDPANAPFQSRIALGQTTTPAVAYTITNAKVYQSTNFGQTWTSMDMTGYDTARLMRNVNGSRGSSAVGAASSGGRFWVNYGSGWSTAGDITNGTFNTSYIWFDTTNDQILYGATVAPTASAHHLFKSVNGGATWTFIDQTSGGGDNGFPFGIPVHVIQNDPTSHTTLYAGTDFGVYKSTDSGATWARFGTGLPLVATRDLYLAPDGAYLRAATFGRGVWEISLSAPVSVTLDKTSATLAVNGTTTFTAALANTTTNNTVNWTATGGTATPANTVSGAATTYTAPATVGIYTLTATSVEDNTKQASATISVYNPAILAVTVSPTTSNLVLPTGGSTTFTASVAGAPTNQVTWSASGGNITQGGVFTATTSGTYTVTATSIYSASAKGNATAVVRSLDLNADTKVDVFDLLPFAAAYGPGNGPADFDGSGTVDDTDLTTLLNGIH